MEKSWKTFINIDNIINTYALSKNELNEFVALMNCLENEGKLKHWKKKEIPSRITQVIQIIRSSLKGKYQLVAFDRIQKRSFNYNAYNIILPLENEQYENEMFKNDEKERNEMNNIEKSGLDIQGRAKKRNEGIRDLDPDGLYEHGVSNRFSL